MSNSRTGSTAAPRSFAQTADVRGAELAERQLAELERLTRRNPVRPFFGTLWDAVRARPSLRRLMKLTPSFLRPSLANARLFGRIDPSRRHGLTIVSHELTASGAPKLVLEISRVAVEDGIQPIVISPTSGPFQNVLTDLGALVVIDPTVTDYFCASSALLDASDTVLVNTAACFKTIPRLSHPERCIWYFHETDLIRELLAAPEFPIAVRGVREAWAVSHPTKALLDPLRSDVLLVPPGIQPLAAQQDLKARARDGVLRLALIGGVEARKGHDIIADAIAALPADLAQRVAVRAIGPINDALFAERWRSQISRLDGMRYDGVVAPDKIADLMGEVDGVVIPSRDEPFSLVALEAMSCGKLVLCSRRCGVSDFLTDSVDAYIAPDSDAKDFSALLTRVMREPSRWDDIGNAGKRLFFEKFSNVAFADRVRDSLRTPHHD